jgi:5-methylcytosine-specific restriction endonuclease McrA
VDAKLKSFIISVLRKSTFSWRERGVAYKAAKVQVGEYSTGKPKFKIKCGTCGGLFLAKDTQMDHIDPVVPLDGYQSGMDFDLNEYAVRLFCPASGWAAICKPCHDIKTDRENKERKANKKA